MHKKLYTNCFRLSHAHMKISKAKRLGYQLQDHGKRTGLQEQVTANQAPDRLRIITVI